MHVFLLSEATSARRRIPFYMVDVTDGVTPETGVTFTGAEIQVSKNGGAFADFAGTATEVADGLYYYEFSAAELDTLGFVVLKVNDAVARVFMGWAQVVAYNPNVSTNLGLSALPTAAPAAAGGLPTLGTGTGQINPDGAGRVRADVERWLTGTPNALSTGRVDASVGAIAANALTATAIATGAITNAKFAANAIDSAVVAPDAITSAQLADGTITEAKFGAGAITSTVVAASAIGATQLATGAITNAKFAASAIDATAIAANALTAAKIATDAIGAAQVAADAVTEIQAGLATAAVLATVQADTDDIQDRLPAALVGGRMDSSVGAMATDTLTSGALAASAVSEIQTGLATSAALATVQSDTDDIQARLPAALVGGRIDASAGVIQANVITATSIAANALTSAKIAAGAIGASQLATDAVTEIQTGLATTAALDLVQADTDDIQARLPTTLNAGRMRTHVEELDSNTITAAVLATDAVNEIADGVWDEPIAGHAAAGSTGEALSNAGAGGTPLTAQQVRDAMKLTPTGGAPGAGSVDEHLDDILTDTNAGGAGPWTTATGFATSAALSTVQADTDNIQTRLPAALVGGRMDSSVGAVANDAITAASIAAGAITSSEAPALANLDVAVSTRSSHTAANVDTVLSGTHGAGSWATATGFAIAGSAMTLEAGERAAMASALLSAALPSTWTVAATLDATRKFNTNRLEASPGNPGTVICYDDDDVTPAFTLTIRDYQGNAVVGVVGSPALRGSAT